MGAKLGESLGEPVEPTDGAAEELDIGDTEGATVGVMVGLWKGASVA